MGFVQLIEITTSDIDAIRKFDDAWEEATRGERTARREIFARDRNQADRYVALVFFDSYESAMTNSELPETQALAEQMRAAASSIAYRDLDVIEDRS